MVDADTSPSGDGSKTGASSSDSPSKHDGNSSSRNPPAEHDSDSDFSSDSESGPGAFSLKINKLHRENDRGKELFTKGDYDAAVKIWSKSIDALSAVLGNAREQPAHDITEEALQEFTRLYVVFCSNLALAYIKTGEYEKCKQFCQYVLMYDDKSLKAHLRIVQADIKLNDLDLALRNCNKGLEYHPDNVELMSLKNQINEKLKAYENSQKVFFKNIFNKIETDPRTLQVRKRKWFFDGFDPNFDFSSSKIVALYFKVFLFIRRAMMSVTHAYTSAFNRLKHTLKPVTNLLNGFLGKAKSS